MNVNDAIQLEHHRWHNPTPFGASLLGWFLDRPRSYSPSICLHQWVGVREHLREPPVLHEQNMEKQNRKPRNQSNKTRVSITGLSGEDLPNRSPRKKPKPPRDAQHAGAVLPGKIRGPQVAGNIF